MEATCWFVIAWRTDVRSQYPGKLWNWPNDRGGVWSSNGDGSYIAELIGYVQI